MSEKFKKLKAKYLLGAILKSVVCGISAGLVLVGILLLAFKLSAISLGTVWYVIIGVACALIGGAVTFIFFRPTNKNVAKRLDDEFELEERVQTSLEYDGQEGTIVKLQREDTEGKLQSLPRAKFKFSRIWQFCVIAVIAVAVAVTALFVPAKQAGAAVDDNPENQKAVVTEYQIQSVRDIINNVNKSGLKEDVKASSVEYLDALLITLTGNTSGTLTVGQLNNAVYAAINGVELTINGSLTYIALGEALAEGGDANVSKAVLSGGNAYRTYDIKEYGHVLTFDEQRGDAVPTKIVGGLNELQKTLNVTIEDGLSVALLTVGYNSIGAISKSGVAATDTLYGSLNYFFGQLVTLSMNVGEDNASIQSRVKDVINDLRNGLSTELSNQAYAGAMRRYVGNKLKIVFGLGGVEAAEADDTDYGSNDDPGDRPPTTDTPPETGGPGNSIYGSNDDIFNPETRMREKYGDLLGKYSDILNELIASGMYTEEEIAMINAYFDFLWGSAKDKD